jgi:H+-translocating NAD(P) transhydrogenase subunit alpha
VNEIGLDPGIIWLTFFILSIFVGIEVISKVSTVLHTPLMSGTNAIHGIILIGSILVTGHSDSVGVTIVGTIAIIMAAANLVGGFVVTDRMLQMFSRKKPKKPVEEKAEKQVEQKIEQQVDQLAGKDSTKEMPAIKEENA